MSQCPCAELFKIGDDYTREHHPDCPLRPCQHSEPIDGTFTFMGITFPYDATPAHMEVALEAKFGKIYRVSRTADGFTIEPIPIDRGIAKRGRQ